MADDTAPQATQFFLQFAPLLMTMPVQLDKTTSVNLAKVKTYQVSEVTKGDYKPCVFFSETDYLELTPEQNKLFKFYWNIYTRATAFILQSMAQMFPAPDVPKQITEGDQPAA